LIIFNWPCMQLFSRVEEMGWRLMFELLGLKEVS
jgi:hypothetical protein